MRNITLYLDQIHKLISQGYVTEAVIYLCGKLNAWQAQKEHWPDIVATVRAHELHKLLLQDPYVERAFTKPRGYAGDAVLIDFVYSRTASAQTTPLGRACFFTSTGFQAAEGVRLRRDYAEKELLHAHAAGQRILSLACGHFREGKHLIGYKAPNITVVDQDKLSLAEVHANHRGSLNIIQDNVIRFLRAAATRKEQWDYIYTLGLTDYFDERAMTLFYTLLGKVLAPSGHIMLANFVPHHLSVGWMEAVMDWHLIYRTEDDLARHAKQAGFGAHTWTDESGSIAFCEMRPDGNLVTSDLAADLVPLG